MTQKTATPPREGQVLSCCLCVTAPGILLIRAFHPSVGAGTHAHRAFPPGLQQAAFEGVRGEDGPPVHWGSSSRHAPMKGFFISQHSFLASCPCCTVSVVASLSLYCAWSVPLMFQTRSLTVSYLSHRVAKYAFLALPAHRPMCHSPRLPRACRSESFVFKSTQCSLVQTIHCLISSCSVPDTTTLSSRAPGPNVCPPGQSPCQSQTSSALPCVCCQSFSPGHAPFISRGRNWGKDRPEENSLRSNLGGKPKTDSLPQSRGLSPFCFEMPALLYN